MGSSSSNSQSIFISHSERDSREEIEKETGEGKSGAVTATHSILDIQ